MPKKESTAKTESKSIAIARAIAKPRKTRLGRRTWLGKVRMEQSGAVAVEFALILPILITLLFGIFTFGSAYNHYLSISHAAREGARMAATGNYDQSKVVAEAFPADVKSVSISYPSGNNHGQPVRVTVIADFDLSIPFIPAQTIELTSAASMRLEI